MITKDEVIKFLNSKKGRGITTLAGLAAHYDLSLTQFLNDIQVSPTIYNLVERNKAEKKERMRQRWWMSNNSTLQIKLYQLLADDEEYSRLSGDKFSDKTKESKDPLLEVLDAEKVWSNG